MMKIFKRSQPAQEPTVEELVNNPVLATALRDGSMKDKILKKSAAWDEEYSSGNQAFSKAVKNSHLQIGDRVCISGNKFLQLPDRRGVVTDIDFVTFSNDETFVMKFRVNFPNGEQLFFASDDITEWEKVSKGLRRKKVISSIDSPTEHNGGQERDLTVSEQRKKLADAFRTEGLNLSDIEKFIAIGGVKTLSSEEILMLEKYSFHMKEVSQQNYKWSVVENNRFHGQATWDRYGIDSNGDPFYMMRCADQVNLVRCSFEELTLNRYGIKTGPCKVQHHGKEVDGLCAGSNFEGRADVYIRNEDRIWQIRASAVDKITFPEKSCNSPEDVVASASPVKATDDVDAIKILEAKFRTDGLDRSEMERFIAIGGHERLPADEKRKLEGRLNLMTECQEGIRTLSVMKDGEFHDRAGWERFGIDSSGTSFYMMKAGGQDNLLRCSSSELTFNPKEFKTGPCKVTVMGRECAGICAGSNRQGEAEVYVQLQEGRWLKRTLAFECISYDSQTQISPSNVSTEKTNSTRESDKHVNAPAVALIDGMPCMGTVSTKDGNRVFSGLTFSSRSADRSVRITSVEVPYDDKCFKLVNTDTKAEMVRLLRTGSRESIQKFTAQCCKEAGLGNQTVEPAAKQPAEIVLAL